MSLDHFYPVNGLYYDLCIAERALHNARANVVDVWHARQRPIEGWAGQYLKNEYPYWRSNALARLKRCRAAVAKIKAMRAALTVKEMADV